MPLPKNLNIAYPIVSAKRHTTPHNQEDASFYDSYRPFSFV